MSGARPRVELEIETLVVDGLEHVDADALRAAAACELERLVAADSDWPAQRLDGTARVDAGRLPLAPGAAADAVGVEVARAVHRGLAP